MIDKKRNLQQLQILSRQTSWSLRRVESRDAFQLIQKTDKLLLLLFVQVLLTFDFLQTEGDGRDYVSLSKKETSHSVHDSVEPTERSTSGKR